MIPAAAMSSEVLNTALEIGSGLVEMATRAEVFAVCATPATAAANTVTSAFSPGDSAFAA